MISLLLSIISITLAFAAFLINYFSFRRHRTLDNENKYYQYKLDIYQKLCAESAEVVDIYATLLNEIKKHDHSYLSSNPDYLKQLADKFDDAPERLKNMIISYGMFLPNNTVEELQNFIDLFYVETELIKSETVDSIEEITTIGEAYLNEVITNWENFISFLRKDLEIDKLNHNLSRRLLVKHGG